MALKYSGEWRGVGRKTAAPAVRAPNSKFKISDFGRGKRKPPRTETGNWKMDRTPLSCRRWPASACPRITFRVDVFLRIQALPHLLAKAAKFSNVALSGRGFVRQRANQAPAFLRWKSVGRRDKVVEIWPRGHCPSQIESTTKSPQAAHFCCLTVRNGPGRKQKFETGA